MNKMSLCKSGKVTEYSLWIKVFCLQYLGVRNSTMGVVDTPRQWRVSQAQSVTLEPGNL